MFGRLKDWRRVATRCDRSRTVFLSAIALAATVIFWLWVLTLAVRLAAICLGISAPTLIKADLTDRQ